MSRLFRYSGFGLLIDSEVELPELAESTSAGDGGPDLLIRTGPVSRVRRKATLVEELAINVVGAAFLIREGREITVDARPGADPAAVRVVLLGRVMAFLLRQRGWLPLHASGIVIGSECVLFLGVSGSGKSTTAAAFHTAGHLVVTDDVGAVRMEGDDHCVVQPAWPHVRLREDARAVLGNQGLFSKLQIDKYRYDLNHGPLLDLYPVRRICVLEYGEVLSLKRLAPFQAITQLSRHSFVKHRNMEREVFGIHLRDCASVASAVPVYRLVRSRSLVALPELVRLVEDDLK